MFSIIITIIAIAIATVLALQDLNRNAGGRFSRFESRELDKLHRRICS